MHLDRYIVFKLVSSEELVAHCIGEDDYQISVLFPMIVKRFPLRSPTGQLAESITLQPYTYFAVDDEYAFQKYQIIFIKDLDSRYEAEYNRAIDDFVGMTAENPLAYDPNELQDLTDKLQRMFRDKISESDDIEDLPPIHLDGTKTLH